MPETPWRAEYSDGRVAARHALLAWLERDGLAIGEPEHAARALWRYDDIRLIDGPDASGRIRLARVDSAERLIIFGADALQPLQRRCAKLRRAVASGPGWRLVALWSGSALAGLVVLFLVVVPFLARHAGQFLSPRLEADLGNRLADTIIQITAAPKSDREHAECDTPQGRAALDKLTRPLVAQLTLRNEPRIRVVNAPIINAVALPGSQILVFKGILDFAEDPNEIAGIIAHELGHVSLDHPTSLVIERSAVGFMAGLIVGDIFGVSVVAGISAFVLDASYGRDAEAAADQRSYALMKGAGFDPTPVAAFFTRLTAKGSDGELPIAFLRSHPPNDERAKLFQAGPSNGGGQRALNDADWTALKEICN